MSIKSCMFTSCRSASLSSVVVVVNEVWRPGIIAGNRSSAIPDESLFRKMSRFPLNIEPSVDLAVKGSSGMLSPAGLGRVKYADSEGLFVRVLFAVFARSQKALSFSCGWDGGRSLMFLPRASVVIVARVGSMTKVPATGPFPCFGVVGRGVDGAESVVDTRRFAMLGALGERSAVLPAAFFRSSSLAICSSAVSSSVVSPSSSAYIGISISHAQEHISVTYTHSHWSRTPNHCSRQPQTQTSRPRLRNRRMIPHHHRCIAVSPGQNLQRAPVVASKLGFPSQ